MLRRTALLMSLVALVGCGPPPTTAPVPAVAPEDSGADKNAGKGPGRLDVPQPPQPGDAPPPPSKPAPPPEGK